MNDREFDVLVVGGGVLGLAHAIAALRAGLRVAIVERTQFFRGASVRNFGMVWPIGQPAGPSLDLALRSRALWLQTASEVGFRCQTTGSLHLAHDELEWAVLREFVVASPLSGLQLLGPEAVRALQPELVQERLVGGLWSPHEANVDPAATIAALHAWLPQQGVGVQYGMPVVEVREHAARLAGGHWLHAEHVVVCSGDDFSLLFPERFAASDLWRCKLQMLALGPQPAAFRLGPMLAAGLTLLHYKGFQTCPSLPALRERLQRDEAFRLAAGIHVLVSQGDDGRLIVGDSHVYGQEFAPGLANDVEQAILEYLARFLRPPVTTVAARWSGTYALRRGGESTFRDRPCAGVEVVTGVGGSGMTRSMALGEQTVQAWNTKR